MVLRSPGVGTAQGMCGGDTEEGQPQLQLLLPPGNSMGDSLSHLPALPLCHQGPPGMCSFPLSSGGLESWCCAHSVP